LVECFYENTKLNNSSLLNPAYKWAGKKSSLVRLQLLPPGQGWKWQPGAGEPLGEPPVAGD
jgi:hypothetical protein